MRRTERDGSRTERGKTASLVAKHTAPPADQGGWYAYTRELLESPAYRTLSHNARKAFDRVVIEHIGHGRTSNGELIVTHEQFHDYGVTAEYVADALDELAFKGLLRIVRGRAGDGTAHPSRFRLTTDGDYEGAKASNEWRRTTMESAREWSETVRHQMREQRAKAGGRKNSSLRKSEMRPLRVSEIRKAC